MQGSSWWWTIIPVGWVIAGATAAIPQNLLGTLAGTVSGPDGSMLPGVTVTVMSTALTKPAKVVTDDHGGYRVTGLESGSYSVKAELTGFETTLVLNVTIAGGKSNEIHLRLKLAALEQVLTVSSEVTSDSLESSKIRESSAQDVGEALASLAGIWKIRRGSIANDLVLRGYQGDNLTVLIDGIRLYGACPNNMDHAAFHVDFAEVDRIEVGKGPFDLRNQGSLGGSVNIVTRRPPGGFQLFPHLSLGSFGFVNPSVTGSYGSDRFGLLGGYSYRVSDPYETGSGMKVTEYANYRPTAVDARAFDIGTGWMRLEMVPRSQELIQLAYTRQDAGRIIYPYLLMDAVYDDANRVNAGYDINHPVGILDSLRFQGYFTQVRHWMTDELRSSSLTASRGYSMATLAKTSVAGGRVEASARHVVFGTELFERRWDSATQLAMTSYQPQFAIPGVQVRSLGAFIDYSRTLGSSLRIDLGGRLDRTATRADEDKANTNLYFAYQNTRVTSSSDLYSSGKVRLSYRLPHSVTVNGGLGHAARVPDPQERYFALRRMGSDWVGNPQLRPIRGTGLDGGVSYRHARVFLSALMYRDALENFIAVVNQPLVNAVPSVSNTMARSYRNTVARMDGAELEWMLSLTNRLFLTGDLARVRGTQKRSPAVGIGRGNLTEIPPLRSRSALRYDAQVESGGFFAEVEAVFSSPQKYVDTDLKETPTPGYGLVNLRLGGNLKKFRLTMGINNLANRSFIEHLSYQRDPFRSGVRVPEPGRYFHASLSYAF
jgi:iron complex outermembrane receptor protein